jgi:hypothetical protein
MKNNKLEAMREARLRALNFQKINFTTIHLAAERHGPNAGSITVAYKEVIPEEGSKNYSAWKEGFTYYRIQFAFCSPSEKNPSRIFGEGLAAGRWSKEKKAILLTIPPNGKLVNYLRRAALQVGNMNHISWLQNVYLEDLV